MAYEIPEKWPVEQQHEYVIDRSAAIEALASMPTDLLALLPQAEREEELRRAAEWQKLLPSWTSLENDLVEERATVAKEEREALVKRGRMRGGDSRFDPAVAALSASAYVAAGNNYQQPPYTTLFGSVSAKDAQRLGPVNAVKWARPVAEKAVGLDDALAPAALRLRTVADLLERLGTERDEVEVVRARAQARRIKLHARLEDLVAETERLILGFLPRVEAKEVVRQLLSPTATRPGKPRQSEPDDE